MDKEESQAMDCKTSKLSIIYGAHHPKPDVDRLYMKRSRRGTRQTGVEDCVSMEIHDSGDKLFQDVQNSRLLQNRNIRAKKRYEKVMRLHAKQKRCMGN